jgi:2,3-bisphosphoglycerate-dependent phosphoglycerate mutase
MPRMRKTLYIVRHCKAAGQQPEATLTVDGHVQAEQLAEKLAALPIERIISSPFVRAKQSIAPLAERLGLPIVTDTRLAERVLAVRRHSGLGGGAEIELRGL